MKHRRLTWYYHSGMATIRGNFKQKPIDMLMSTTQAAVVLLFNSGEHVFLSPLLLLSTTKASPDATVLIRLMGNLPLNPGHS